MRSLAEAFRHFSSGWVITDPRQSDNPLIYVNAGFTCLTGCASTRSLTYPAAVTRRTRFFC
ncbi:MAG TPA: hypothetical protein VF627_11530 [Abditibacterium sp.]